MGEEEGKNGGGGKGVGGFFEIIRGSGLLCEEKLFNFAQLFQPDERSHL